MNWLDIAIAIPLTWGLYKGFTSGIIMEVARIIALIAGVYLAVRFAQELSEYLYKNSNLTTEFLPIISFAMIFIVVVVLVHIFAKTIEKLVKAVALGWANKAVGAAFGMFRVAFVLSVIVMMLSRFELLSTFEKGETAKEAFLYSPLKQLAPFIIPVLEDVDKDSILDKIDRKVDRTRDAIRDIIHE